MARLGGGENLLRSASTTSCNTSELRLEASRSGMDATNLRESSHVVTVESCSLSPKDGSPLHNPSAPWERTSSTTFEPADSESRHWKANVFLFESSRCGASGGRLAGSDSEAGVLRDWSWLDLKLSERLPQQAGICVAWPASFIFASLSDESEPAGACAGVNHKRASC